MEQHRKSSQLKNQSSLLLQHQRILRPSKETDSRTLIRSQHDYPNIIQELLAGRDRIRDDPRQDPAARKTHKRCQLSAVSRSEESCLAGTGQDESDRQQVAGRGN